MIVIAGEALIDLVAEPDGRFRALPGGSPANVAVGLARLGNRTELLARISQSPFGRLIRDHLTSNGIGLRHAVTANEPATLAVVTREQGTEPHYDFYLDGTADWAWADGELPAHLPGGAMALCTGSLAMALEPGASALGGLVRSVRNSVTVVFDPNVRPSVMPDASRIEDLVPLAHVVKLSEADVRWLAPDESAEDLAQRWAGSGPQLVVVTQGANGAYAVTSSGTTVAVPAPHVDITDTIGAGDAFTAGLVDGLARRQLLGPGPHRLAAIGKDDLRKIVEHATLVAALTCTRPGADPPTADELASLGGSAIGG